jgi:Flp pilus assembly protein TadB
MSNITPITAASVIHRGDQLWINGIVHHEIERQRIANHKREADLTDQLTRARSERNRNRDARMELLLKDVNRKPGLTERLQAVWEVSAATVLCWMERHGFLEWVSEGRDE